MLQAEIKSKTTQIFSQIMVSGVVNPILGGVLLSGLLTSPDTNDLILTMIKVKFEM